MAAELDTEGAGSAWAPAPSEGTLVPGGSHLS